MVQLEGYSLIRVLYEGGSSVVYRATRVSDKTPVICKMLRMEYPSAHDLSAFRREYEIAARLGGAGTVQIHALEKVANSLAIVMEDVGAESLNRQPSLVHSGIGEKLIIACQVADALARVHGQNIIHKDINPSNIIRNPQTGVVRIIDFGIATELTRENVPLPGMGSMEGTLAYISPEQTGRMIQPVDYRTDLYSLGVTLYELFTGRLPFTGNDMLELVYSHIARVPVAPRDVNPEIPEPVAAIILKLMSKAPEDRYQGASGLLGDLERCQNEWNETGKIHAFPIGQSDGSDRFTIPNRLYGRQEELAIIHDTLDENAKEAPRLLLVGGAPGVGKSSLIHEIDRFLLGKNGFLACGKFNQLEKNVPYSALLLALRHLLDQLLCASAERIDAYKDSILSALGANAGLLVELLPKLGQVLGPQDPPAPLDPVAAQNRFQLAVRQFIEAFTQDGHPVAIFLDDLQWADSPTLDLIHYLLRGNRIANLLIVGAYRDSDVGEEHPLTLLCKALGEKSQDDQPLHRTILVKPLAIQDVNQLVADTLHCDPATTLELASIVHNKTDGNPFFVNQMLITLHARGAFTYDASLRRWRWNLDQVAKAELGDNVVEFLVKKLASLSVEAREVVKIAACIGNQFDLQTVASVHGQGWAALGRGLWEAIAKEIVIPLDHNYRLLHLQEGSVDIATIEAVLRFQHDRILHAAYAMIPANERPDIHHRIGREMLRTFRRVESDAAIFTLVNHLNLGKKHVSEPDARRELAELNVLVGRKAMLSTAFRTAAEYFGKGQSLLSDEEWACLPGQRFSLSFQRAESLFLAGELRQAEALVGPLLDLADGDVQKASVYKLRSKIREFQGDLLGAIDEVRKGLKPFGLSLPESKEEIGQKVGEGLGRMQQSLARAPIDALLELGEMTDAGKIEAMRLLAQAVPAAIQADYALYMVATMMMMDLTMTCGTTPESCKCIADCGIIYSTVLGDYEAGYQLGKTAFALIDKLKVGWQKPSVCFSFTYVSHLRKHYQEGLDYYGMSYQSGMEVGDLQHAAYAWAHKVHLMMWVGANLQACQRETERAIAFLKESNGLVQLMLADIVHHAINKLQTTPDEDGEKEFAKVDGQIMAAIEQSRNVVLLVRVSMYNAFLHFLLGDMEAAERWNATAEGTIFAVGSDFPVADHFLVQSLILLHKLRAGMASDRDAAMEKIAANLARLKKLADNCPENFAHKHLLVAAELSAYQGAPIETTLELYKQALASIGKGDFVQMVALINECQGVFWIGRHNDTIAKAFLREAHYHYGQWGAFRKLAAMERTYHTYFALRDDAPTKERESRRGGTTRRSGRGLSNAALDITSIVKTTQAISSEIRTEKLLRTLLQTIVENAGAQSGCLLLSDGSPTGLGMVAFKDTGSDEIEILKPRPYRESDHLCREIVEYVERTRESVVLDDAAAAGGFTTNAYIQKNAVKSVLCMPVLHKNTLKGVVYLENNLADHVFTTERLNILSILAAQASISIENAQLYQEMESKVQERTKLLHQANEKLRQLTLIDPLTHLNNRRFFHDFITGSYERYIRKLQRALTSTENRSVVDIDIGMGVFIIDIDHFKEVNDTWGHAAGDSVLVAISKILKSIVRADDFIVRWGGEEFLVVLSNTSLDYLDQFARKVLVSIRDAPIQLPDDRRISRTCSIGYMQIPFDSTVPELLTLEQTIKMCDCAMYVAKEMGRNRAVRILPKGGEKADEALRDSLLTSLHKSNIDTSRLTMRQISGDG